MILTEHPELCYNFLYVTSGEMPTSENFTRLPEGYLPATFATTRQIYLYKKELADSKRRKASLQPQHVLHTVETRFLAGQPLGGSDGAVGEGIAAVGAVGKFEALANAAENHRMLADDVAGAD